MSSFDNPHSPYQSCLTNMQGQSSYSDDEIKILRHKAWVELGVLIVSPSDRRLTTAEALRLREIGERLYGGEL